MPFSRPPTVSSRSIDRSRPHKPRRSEPASPPRRSNTRSKVNVVSKASMAMLNPAYAMGIESGPSWFEEQQQQRYLAAQGTTTPTLSPSGVFAADSPWAMDATPELEAFVTEEVSAPQHEEGGLGLVLGAPAMQRQTSSESVFEDDEPIYPRRPANNISTSSPGSSTLSRFFTWKKPTGKGKPSGPLSQVSSWEAPQSAPPHILSFDLPSHEDISASLPPTPADASVVPLPTSVSAPLTNCIRGPIMSRKSSMPTLRDIRRATGSPLTVEIPLPHISTSALAADSFYWRNDSPRTASSISPSTSNSSSLSSKSSATRSSSRISSMGRGAARKSSLDSPKIPTILIKAPKKKQQQQRYDPWGSQNMPPVPSHPSVASLIAEERQESRSSTTAVSTRRRSRSVDALPVGFINGRNSTAPIMERSDSSQTEIAQANSTNISRSSHIVGTASPKLLARTNSLLHNESPPRNKNLLQVVESPVVVNIMPPTPDLGLIEQGTFEGEVASPSVRRSRSETEIAHLIGGQEDSNAKQWHKEDEVDSDEETFLPYATGERFDESFQSRIESSSSVDESPVSVSSQATGYEDDEPFGFARSMSTMSLSSEASVDSELSEEGAASVEDAKILSASSTMSSFSRALLVSPRLGEISSWTSSQSGLSSSHSGNTSLTSLVSSNFSPSPPSAASSDIKKVKRSSKRLSGLPSLSSGQSLASLMTISSSILDYGAEYIFPSDQTSNLSSPVELQGQMDGELTPRLSDGFHSTNTTKPLVVRKVHQTQQQQTASPSGVLSPISPRPFPRAHNAESPHLELDLSLPLDLHEIGLGLATHEIPRRRGEKPRVPNKSRARHQHQHHHHHHQAVEPKTPPTATRRLSSLMKEERENETFGLGLGLGLDSAFSQHGVEIDQWRRQNRQPTVNVNVGMAL